MLGLERLFLFASLCVGLICAQQAIEEIIEKPDHKDSTSLPIVAEGENRITILTDDEQEGGAGSDLGGLDLNSLIQMTGIDLQALQNVDSQELNRILNTAIDAVKRELNKPDSAGTSTDVTSVDTGKGTTDQGSTDTLSETPNVPAGLQAVTAKEDPLKIIQEAVDNVNKNQLVNTANAFELNDIQSSITRTEDTSKAFRSGVGTAVQPDISPNDNDVDNTAQREFLRQLIEEEDGDDSKSDDGSFILRLPDGTFRDGNEFTNTQANAPSAEAELRRLQRERQELLRRLADVQMNFADRNRADTNIVRENTDDIINFNPPSEFGNVNFRPNTDTFLQPQPQTFQPGVGNSLLVDPEIVTDTESTFDRRRFDPVAEIGNLNTPDRIRQLFTNDDDDTPDDVAAVLQSDSNLALNTDTPAKAPQARSVAVSSAVVPALPPPPEIVQPVSDTSVAPSFNSEINRIIRDTERRFQSFVAQEGRRPVPARTTDEESMISFSTDQRSNGLALILERERKRKQELERQLRAFTRPGDDDSITIFSQHSDSVSNEHLRGFSSDDTVFSEGDLSRFRNVDTIPRQNEFGTNLPENRFPPQHRADDIIDDFNFDSVGSVVPFGQGWPLNRPVRNNGLNDRNRRPRTRNIRFLSLSENDDSPFTGPVNRIFHSPSSFNPRIGLRHLRNRFNTGFPSRIRQGRRVFRRLFRPRTVLGYPFVRRLF